ncbi:MAG: choice-of-anchor U domain-containing protein, partial [Nitrososphaerales archaeon]
TTEEPVENTTEEPVENTTEEPVENTTEEPVENTTEEPVENTTAVTLSVETSTGTKMVTIGTSAGSFTSYSSVDLSSLPVSERPVVDLPFGLFSFTISGLRAGETVTVTITFPANVPAGSQYWKLQGDSWYQLPNELVGDNDGDNLLTITLTDGGLGDGDGLANGEIVDPGGPGAPATDSISEASGCSYVGFSNDSTAYARCIVIDTKPPVIQSAFVTPNDNVCVQTVDDTRTVRVAFNGREIPEWLGSMGYFCSNEAFPLVIRVVAEDIAGNKSEMIMMNTQSVVTTSSEQTFNAITAKELNPHHGIEGIVIETSQPLRQIRFSTSPEFSKDLHLSETQIMELNGKHLVEVVYKGQYADTPYGKERFGQIYVFGANKGKLATFDVVINDDIRLYKHNEEQKHGMYDLQLISTSVIDTLNLNYVQRAELEAIFAGDELSTTQQNILSMILQLLNV